MLLLDPPLITLTTDFGHIDTYVGVMKGVMLGIAPQARLIDLTHEIGPQNVLEASARLEAALPFFPRGTIHLVVVDPGVGSERAAVIVRTAESLFVAPDNGVLSLPLRRQPPIETIKLSELARPYFREPVSATFHGRDIFAPIAARLASGAPASRFGLSYPNMDLVSLKDPTIDPCTVSGDEAILIPILYVDRFGNLVMALRREDWLEASNGHPYGSDGSASVEFQAGALRWRGIVTTFAAVAVGAPLAYWGSAGRLEIAVRNGSAAQLMGVQAGDTIRMHRVVPNDGT